LASHVTSLKGTSLILRSGNCVFDNSFFTLDSASLIHSISHYCWNTDYFLECLLTNPQAFANLETLKVTSTQDPLNPSYFGKLTEFSGLKNLLLCQHLSEDTIESFFRNFSLPNTLESLDLEIDTSDWEYVIKGYKENPFEELPLFEKFRNSFQGMKKLKKLHISCDSMQPYFPDSMCLTILQRVNTITDFKIECFDFEDEDEIQKGHSSKKVNLGSMLNIMAKNGTKLENLSVSSPAISMRTFLEENYDKLCIENISMTGVFSELMAIRHLLRISKDKQGSVSFNNFWVFGGNELEFALNSIINSSKTPKISVSCEYRGISKVDFLDTLGHILLKMKPRNDLSFKFRTKFDLESQVLVSIGNYLKRKPKVPELIVRGNDRELHFRRNYTLFRINLLNQ